MLQERKKSDKQQEVVGSRSEIYWATAEVQARKHDFQDFKVQHVNRFCNSLAHSFGQNGLGEN